MSSQETETDLFTPIEAAARLRVCRRTLENMHRDGRGPARTVLSGKVFFRGSDLQRFLTERTEKLKRTPDDLASLIEGDLREHFPHDVKGSEPFITLFAVAVAALRQVDENIQRGHYTPDHAIAFVHTILKLCERLPYLSPTTRTESLAGEIVAAALRTAAANFPELLATSGP